jgi:hypothetical protein
MLEFRDQLNKNLKLGGLASEEKLFRPERYDFHQHNKWIFMEKKGPNSPAFKEKKLEITIFRR